MHVDIKAMFLQLSKYVIFGTGRHPVRTMIILYIFGACCAITPPFFLCSCAFRLCRFVIYVCMRPGGHFAAMEEPDALADDMIKFFSKYH